MEGVSNTLGSGLEDDPLVSNEELADVCMRDEETDDGGLVTNEENRDEETDDGWFEDASDTLGASDALGAELDSCKKRQRDSPTEDDRAKKPNAGVITAHCS